MANWNIRKPPTKARIVITLEVNVPDVRFPRHAVDVLRERLGDMTEDCENATREVNDWAKQWLDFDGDLLDGMSIEVAK